MLLHEAIIKHTGNIGYQIKHRITHKIHRNKVTGNKLQKLYNYLKVFVRFCFSKTIFVS